MTASAGAPGVEAAAETAEEDRVLDGAEVVLAAPDAAALAGVGRQSSAVGFVFSFCAVPDAAGMEVGTRGVRIIG